MCEVSRSMSNLRMVSRVWDHVTAWSLRARKGVLPRAGVRLDGRGRSEGVVAPEWMGVAAREEVDEEGWGLEMPGTERYPKSLVRSIMSDDLEEVETGKLGIGVCGGGGGENKPSSSGSALLLNVLAFTLPNNVWRGGFACALLNFHLTANSPPTKGTLEILCMTTRARK